MTRLIAVLSLATIGLMGCGATLRGQPESAYDLTRNPLAKIVFDERLTPTAIKNALETPSLQNRNAIVFARMAEIDLLYHAYENEVLAESRRSGFALSLAGLAAGLLGGYATGQASQIYSLIGGGIEAVQTSYDKELLAESTIQAFISQMRAGRAAVRAEMLNMLSASSDAYPIEAALSDLERYRQAGTIATAIVGITEQAAKAEKEMTETADEAAIRFRNTITGVITKSGSAIDSVDLRLERTRRLAKLNEKIRNNTITSEKLLQLFNDPLNEDLKLKNEFNKVKAKILNRSGQAEIRAEDINMNDRRKITLAIAYAEGNTVVDKLEQILK